MPAGSAEKKAGAQVEAVVLDVLTPICVARFHQDKELEQLEGNLKPSNV